MATSFRPTALDLALAADPVAEAARVALVYAASEPHLPPVPSEGLNPGDGRREQLVDKEKLPE